MSEPHAKSFRQKLGHELKSVAGVTLVLAKVVLILEHVPLGSWLERQPAWVDLLVRAALYTLGSFAALVLEKAFEARHEYGGFGAALTNIFQHRDMPHVWANTICIAGALITYNFLTLLRLCLGPNGLRKILLSPPVKPVDQP